MTRKNFKEKYLINAFYWITENNHLELQNIMQEFGIICHTGSGIIGWHSGFKNLLTFKPDEFHNFEYYQKTDCWFPNASYGEPKNYESMIEDYSKLPL